MPQARVSPGLLLVLSAPSGAGETSLGLRLMKEMAEAVFSVRYTTRPPRGGERNGEHYHCIDPLTFQKKIDLGDFVEWAEVHGHFYGSPQASVERVRASGGIAVFDIDVQGGTAIKRKYPYAVSLFVLPPSIEQLERRLRQCRPEPTPTPTSRTLAP